MRSLAFVLLLPILSACAHAQTQRPQIDLGEYGPVVDTIFQRMGKRELLLCAKSRQTGPLSFKVYEIAIPIQTADSVNVFGDGCPAEYNGDLHNHPQELGGLYTGGFLGRLSTNDRMSLSERNYMRFSIVWFAPNQWTAMVKLRDNSLVGQ